MISFLWFTNYRDEIHPVLFFSIDPEYSPVSKKAPSLSLIGYLYYYYYCLIIACSPYALFSFPFSLSLSLSPINAMLAVSPRLA